MSEVRGPVVEVIKVELPPGGDPVVGQPLVVSNHPDEDIRQAVLGLCILYYYILGIYTYFI